MSNERQETIADIVSEMREYADSMEKQMEASNVKTTRNALESVRNWCINRLVNAPYQVTIEGLLSFVNIALSKPPRNCDVGTADEQAKRFHSFCEKFQSRIQGMCSPLCPCIDCGDVCHCMTKWSQMPYKEGVAK